MSTTKRSSVSWTRAEAKPSLHLGAFGKHPGWDDHIEDLGLETERLVRVRQKMYMEGVAGNIDSGAWEKLEEAQRLPGFGHEFTWRSGGDMVVGRLWSSRDGKGRTKYPMAVVAHCAGVPVSWIESTVMPRLAEVERACVTTESAAEVRRIVDQAREDLRAGLPAQGSELGGIAGASELAGLADAPELGPGRVGLCRVLYEIDREMGAFRPVRADARKSTSRTLNVGAQHLRVPACAPTTMGAATLWTGVLAANIDAGVDIIVLRPHGKDWIDLIVGEPAAAQLFCVRASETGLAPTTSVPYSMDPHFVARCDAMVAAWKEGRVSLEEFPGAGAAKPEAPAGPGGGDEQKKRRSWIFWGGTAGAVVVAAAGYTVYQSMRHGPGPGPVAMNTAAPKAPPVVPTVPTELPAELKARQDAARERMEPKAVDADKEAQQRKAREEQDRLAREAEAAKAGEEAARKEKEEADRKAADDAARKGKEEADRLAREKDDAARLAKAKEEEQKKADEAQRVAREAESAKQRVEALVKRAAALNATLGDGNIFGDALEQARAIGNDPDFGAAKDAPEVKALVERVRGLDAMPATPDALLPVALGAGPGTMDRAIRAWDKLSVMSATGGWPLSNADLAGAADAAKVLRNAAGAVNDKSVGEQLSTHVVERGRLIWTSYFSRLGAADGAAIERACELREAFGVDAASLPARERFNVLLCEFKREGAAVADADAARARAGALAAQVAALGAPVAERPDVKSAMEALGAAVSGPPKAKAPDVSTLGPGSRGWKGESGAHGAAPSVVFRGPAGVLEFVRVDAPSGPVYLCTTEVSVGVFIGAVDGATAWSDVLPALRGFKPGAPPEEVKGARAWAFEPAGGPAQRIRVSEAGDDPGRGWMTVGAKTGGTPYYPDTVKVEPPSASSPMQYVSPVGAAYVAGLLGCRLPTSAEWAAAGAMGAESAGNRRDLSWRRVVEFLVSKPARVQYDLVWPDEGVCLGSEIAGTAVARGPKADAAVTGDDGTVWFAPVEAGDGTFKHLIGNVAEYTFEDSAVDAKAVSMEQIKSMVGKGDGVRTVGASALSAREVDPARPYHLPKGADPSRAGYSDVGFRLAFSAGGGGAQAVAAPDVVAVVRRAAGELKYLSP